MPRAPRIEYPGAYYHVLNRGDHGEPIFKDRLDREEFLKVLSETCERTGWWVHSYCLMPNHYHLLIETPRANLVSGMQWLNSTYTLRYNYRHKLRGHLFQGRYKALLVEGKDPEYFLGVSDYIHMNPLRAKRLIRGSDAQETLQSFWCYPWNSAFIFGRKTGISPEWLRWERVFGELGLKKDSPENRRKFRRGLEKRWLMETGQETWARIRRGWYVGTEDFREKMLEKWERLAQRSKPSNWSGQLVDETEEQRAEKLYLKGIGYLKQAGYASKAEDLVGQRADWRKTWLAWWIYSQSRVTLRWVSEKLRMGDPSGISHACRRVQRRMQEDRRFKHLAELCRNSKFKD